MEQNGYFPEENNACSPDLQADLVKKIKLLSSPASKFISKFNNEKIIMTADTEGRLFDSSDDRVLCASTLEQPSLMSDRVLYCMHKLDLARQLFSVGMQVDPQHGPLYHAYGNMELVSVKCSFFVFYLFMIIS